MADDYLSPEGRRRREQILQLALRDMRNTRRRRWILPGAGVTLAIGLVVMMSLPKPRKQQMVAMHQAPLPASGINGVGEVHANPPATPVVEYVATDPTIADRLTLKPVPPRWVAVDDDQFVKELADAGKPMGLAYVNGKAILLGRE
jgi:hypothetical protein